MVRFSPRFARWSILVVVILAVIGYALYQRQTSQSDVSPTVNHRAPDFTLQTLDGKTVSLHDFKGKRVFLNFWASWCNPCQKEAPDLVRQYQRYGKQIVFVGVNLTHGDTKADMAAFLQKYHVTYLSLTDPQGKVSDLYHVAYLPTNFFIDTRGVIQQVHFGQLTKKEGIDAAFQQLANSP